MIIASAPRKQGQIAAISPSGRHELIAVLVEQHISTVRIKNLTAHFVEVFFAAHTESLLIPLKIQPYEVSGRDAPRLICSAAECMGAVLF
ncbi:hypothetical protein BRAS3809_520018 [Bradyrhizobium sp. STM 3809]|nr:hypothetical protein BRAS3809_520018 [Bradyrhizobium sp. STM 3809]